MLNVIIDRKGYYAG